jgi:hypothetical protein
MKIKTNNHKRPLLSVMELSEEIIKEQGLEYIIDDEQFTPRLFWYGESLYDTHEFVWLDKKRYSAYRDVPPRWDGIQSQSFFHGILIQHTEEDNGDMSVVVGQYVQ